MFTMKFYCSKNKQGSIIVQNWIGGYQGQTHVHKEKDFKKWVEKNNINKYDIIFLNEGEINE